MDRPAHAGLRHLALHARDLDAMKRFYVDVLGLQEIGKLNSPVVSGYYLTDGTINLAILHFKTDQVAGAERGKEWSGPARIAGKFVEPAWSPPDSVRRDHPELPDVIPGGSPSNPMGARAITLDRDEIAIHGTTTAMRASIGAAASYGCIRMLNEDVIDLFDRVAIGAPVMMMREPARLWRNIVVSGQWSVVSGQWSVASKEKRETNSLN